MRTLATFRRARALAVLGVTGLVLTVAPAAHADTAGAARARARALLAQVHRLQAQVKIAEQRYEAVLTGVARAVTASIETDRSNEQVAVAADAARAQLDGKVRGLYMSGGPLALYVTLLGSGSPTEFQDQAAVVSRLVSIDRDAVQAVDAASRAAEAQAAAAARRARARIATERSVALVATRVLRLLDQEQALLDQANARVAQIDAARAALAAQAGAYRTITEAGVAALRVLPPPAPYLSLYRKAAATCPGLPWTVLAAIGQVESGHGRDTSTSYAGAMGPMQFLPSTFRTYAVDGDNDGVTDIMDPADAIFTAAAYLCANGAGSGRDGLARAVWHYNHADWYVQMVLALARKYTG